MSGFPRPRLLIQRVDDPQAGCHNLHDVPHCDCLIGIRCFSLMEPAAVEQRCKPITQASPQQSHQLMIALRDVDAKKPGLWC